MAVFPSMKAGKFLAVLMREPFHYEIDRQNGSHRILTSIGYPKLLFSFHDGQTIPPGIIRKYLVKELGLTEPEALKLLQ